LIIIDLIFYVNTTARIPFNYLVNIKLKK